MSSIAQTWPFVEAKLSEAVYRSHTHCHSAGLLRVSEERSFIDDFDSQAMRDIDEAFAHLLLLEQQQIAGVTSIEMLDVRPHAPALEQQKVAEVGTPDVLQVLPHPPVLEQHQVARVGSDEVLEVPQHAPVLEQHRFAGVGSYERVGSDEVQEPFAHAPVLDEVTATIPCLT